jgi:hypothetical protein
LKKETFCSVVALNSPPHMDSYALLHSRDPPPITSIHYPIYFPSGLPFSESARDTYYCLSAYQRSNGL